MCSLGTLNRSHLIVLQLFLGALSDRLGRKPVLVTSSICLALCTLLFGFSVNYAMAVVARFLTGLVDGKYWHRWVLLLSRRWEATLMGRAEMVIQSNTICCFNLLNGFQG